MRSGSSSRSGPSSCCRCSSTRPRNASGGPHEPVRPPDGRNPRGTPARSCPMTDAVLQVRGASIRFGGVEALRDVGLAVHAGEVVALAGDNGAGKSTLIKVISGVYVPSAGEVRFLGE